MPSLPAIIKILSILTKNDEKQELNLSRSALFHLETRVSLKYFVNYLWKEFLVLTSRQTPSNLIFLTIFVTLISFTHFNLKLEQVSCKKGLNFALLCN